MKKFILLFLSIILLSGCGKYSPNALAIRHVVEPQIEKHLPQEIESMMDEVFGDDFAALEEANFRIGRVNKESMKSIMLRGLKAGYRVYTKDKDRKRNVFIYHDNQIVRDKYGLRPDPDRTVFTIDQMYDNIDFEKQFWIYQRLYRDRSKKKIPHTHKSSPNIIPKSLEDFKFETFGKMIESSSGIMGNVSITFKLHGTPRDFVTGLSVSSGGMAYEPRRKIWK